MTDKQSGMEERTAGQTTSQTKQASTDRQANGQKDRQADKNLCQPKGTPPKSCEMPYTIISVCSQSPAPGGCML